MKFFARYIEIQSSNRLDGNISMTEVQRVAFVALLLACVLVGCKNGVGERSSESLFSVSATERVEFAPGNLAEGGKGFVEHQWEPGWLFGWGTGNRPADTTDDWNSYLHFDDWGKHIAGGWRTPTADEWNYLLFERTGASEKRAVGTVNGMRGLLLLPDEWELPSECSFVSRATGWDANCYSVSQWEPMERAGAVFLPADGFRWGALPYAFDCEGLYWSSSTESEGCPYTMHFDGNILAMDWDDAPQFGQSVRLVR